jgi:mRNA-degrading endonuclease RelE of RelBE toxin-antitoxin system
MSRTPKYALAYAPEVLDHFDAIEQKYHRLIEKTFDEQLRHTPEEPTRNRKPLEKLPGPFGSTWELRFGPDNRFRVFYEVEGKKIVLILAIGIKEGNRLFFAGEEFRS